jgi:hypothetical protein
VRISTQPDDPGYSPAAFGGTVIFNGTVAHDVFTADEEAGLIVQLVRNEHGLPKLTPDKDDVLLQTHYGVVSIEFPEGHPLKCLNQALMHDGANISADAVQAMLAAVHMQPHPPDRQCGCVDCAPSFEPYPDTPNDEIVQQLAALCDEEVQAPRFLVFLDALARLCKEHGVTLSTSGYDGLQVWDADAKSGPIHCAGIEDRMTPNAQARGAKRPLD